MDAIKELLTNFDLSNFLPKIDTVMGWVTLLLRLAVMAGPVIILVLGLLYFFAPPKEANHRFGFRCYLGMGSVDAWLFTQRLAGIALGVLGLALSIVMAVGVATATITSTSSATMFSPIWLRTVASAWALS